MNMDVIRGDVENVKVLKEIIKTSLGPNGLHKLLVDINTGEVIATAPSSAYANIFRNAQPKAVPNGDNHQPSTPITTMVGALLQAQQHMTDYAKDGSISTVLLACQLIESGYQLLSSGISQNVIAEVYHKGLQQAINILESMPKQTIKVDFNSQNQMQEFLRLILSSKNPSEALFLAQFLSKALGTVIKSNGLSQNSIHLCSCVGGDVTKSQQIPGIVLPYAPISAQKSIENHVKVAVFATSLQESNTKLSMVASLQTPQLLKQWQKEEEALLKSYAMAIINSGANLIATSGTIHNYVLHWFDIHNIVALQSVSKNELLALCEATGAKLLYKASYVESIDIGTAQSFGVLNFSGGAYSSITTPTMVSLVISGTTQIRANQQLQSCRDALSLIRIINSGNIGEHVISGGGVPELNVVTKLGSSYSASNAYLEQHIMASFAESFAIIPKTLADNSGAPIDTYDTLRRLYKSGQETSGIDRSGCIADFKLPGSSKLDNVGPIEFLDTKKQIWTTAVSTACLLLLVDDSIVGNPTIK